MMRCLTAPGCPIEQREKVRERCNLMEEGCYPGAAHREGKGEAALFHHMLELHGCRQLFCLSLLPRANPCGPFSARVQQTSLLLFEVSANPRYQA